MKKKILSGILIMLIAGSGCARGSGTTHTSPADDSIILSESISEVDADVGDSSVQNDEESEALFFEQENLPDDSSRDDSLYDDSYPGDRILSDEAAEQRDEYIIYCPGTDMPDLFEICYPGYEPVSEPEEENGRMSVEGRIGDMKIKWIISDYLDNPEHAEMLDELLIRQKTEGASDYDWVDLFVLDEMNLEKYIADGVNVTMSLKRDLKFFPEHLGAQLPYTQKLASDGRHIRGAALDISPGVFMYRRSIAQDVLGSDDPETVGKAVESWETFRETACLAKNAGYKMLAGYDDAFDVYSQSSTDGWYSEDGSICIDDNLMEWVDTTKKFAEEGCCGDLQMWSDEWKQSITGRGDIFGYFLSAEEISEIKESVTEDNTDSFGDWGIVTGPGAWYRGGTWICAAVNSPNRRFSMEIINNLTCSNDIMEDIRLKTGMTVNNGNVLLGGVPFDESTDRESGTYTESVFCDPFFAGQQTGPVFYEAAERIKNPMADGDKWELDDLFEEAYHPYFKGECTNNDALASFYQVAKNMIFTEDEEW